jgi:hypothetical protein
VTRPTTILSLKSKHLHPGGIFERRVEIRSYKILCFFLSTADNPTGRIQNFAARTDRPLQIAIDCGFHSIVQVLLEGGAEFQDDRYNGLEHALTQRKLDIIKLLVSHGADIHTGGHDLGI